MTHLEPFMLHEPKWAILYYHELCRMVCPPRKWNLPSTSLSPSRICYLLTSKCLACQSLTPRVGVHLRQASSPRNHTPKISTVYPVIPQKVFPPWNSKDVKNIWAKESGDYSLKNAENERQKVPLSQIVVKQGVRIKRPNSLSKCESISFLFPWTFHPP